MFALAVGATRFVRTILFNVPPFSTARTHSFSTTVGLAVAEPLALKAAQRVRDKWCYLQAKVSGFDARRRTARIKGEYDRIRGYDVAVPPHRDAASLDNAIDILDDFLLRAAFQITAPDYSLGLIELLMKLSVTGNVSKFFALQ